MIPCSECRRPARFLTSKNRHLRARRDHHLCLKCFKKLLAKVALEEERDAQAQTTAGSVRTVECAA